MVFAMAMCILYLFGFCPATAIDGGITVELTHRNSLHLPFQNKTPMDMLNDAFDRSVSRAKYSSMNSSASSTLQAVQTELRFGDGEYYMTVSIGTPRKKHLVLLDTGSNLIWIQCKPCLHCYQQADAIFDPKTSSTYKNIPSSFQQCRAVPRAFGRGGLCYYRIAYEDSSSSEGNIAAESFALGFPNHAQPVSLPSITFGCEHLNQGPSNPIGSGVVGLGSGLTSLISQMGSRIGGKKFSYCLARQPAKPGKLYFGRESAVSGCNVVSTPLHLKPSSNLYYLTLLAISVGNERLKFPNNFAGNAVMDSGTAVTTLPANFYLQFEISVRGAIRLQPIIYRNQKTRLCYHVPFGTEVPPVTMHFIGADLKLRQFNSFIWIERDIACLTFASGDSTIIGNVAQTDFWVGYDLERMALSFKPANCTQ